MSDFEDKTRLPQGFSGRVRLFPLPNLVMFPHVVQPLHIFEPRYLDLVEDALATDQLLAIAHLEPGWQVENEIRPPVSPVICIGRIVSHTQLEDGKFNILLLGLRRATIANELPLTRSFREAKVAVLEDQYAKSAAQQRASIQRELLHCFHRLTPESPAAQEQFDSLMNHRLPLGVLTDIISFTMKFDVDLKQRLLSEWNVDRRAEMLVEEMRQLDKSNPVDDNERPFPPEFSAN